MKQAKPNLLTFDIEGFFEASQDIFDVPESYLSDPIEHQAIEENTVEILDLLDDQCQKDTFFILGRIARDNKNLVRRIAEQGHEIACHSMEHRRLYNYDSAQVRSNLKRAKQYLEEASGKEVIGFRAPDFSITKSNLWVFDILQELGFVYDSSVYPTSLHDAFGIKDFPDTPFRLPNGLIEFPMSTARIMNQNVPFGGGGYLRLYPLISHKIFLQHAQ